MPDKYLCKKVPNKKNRQEILLNKIISECDISNIDWQIIKSKIEELEKKPVVHLDEIIYGTTEKKIIYYL